MPSTKIRRLLAVGILLIALFMLFSSTVMAAPAQLPSSTVTFTILHTNDFHGNLEQNSGGSTSNPGMARVARVINDVRADVGADNVLLLDAGDEMQGSLLSNIQKGEPAIAVFKAMGYDAAAFGNHEFDWGQEVLIERVNQAASVYPFLAANVVTDDTGDCATAGWTAPSFAQPYVIKEVGVAPNVVRVGIIGVTTTETPIITIASATAGLCFKDPATSVLHYYDEVKANADVIVILSHLGFTDGGYGYGIPIYGDQTLAQMMLDAGKPADLIIGGHSHTDVPVPPPVIGGVTTVVQARYNGRQVGRADVTVTPEGGISVNWSKLAPTSSGEADPDIEALIASYISDPAYQALINQEIGWTDVAISRYYDGDSLMGYFVNDAIYNDLNNDAVAENDVDMVFNNPGGLRADIACDNYPCRLTYGTMFSILPFGNQTVVGDMTGAKIMELLNQSALLSKGAIQGSGVRYKFFNYRTDGKVWAWGAFDACVIDKSSGVCEPIDLNKTYRVATNEFLAPAGQDTFYAFKYMTNISYWGDMLDGVNRWVSANYTEANPYNGVLDGRITRDGNDAGGSIVPITILHHNDSHGNLAKGTYAGYTQLATLIKQERAYNPERTLLLSAGDNIQGDAMMYYFKSAPLGYAADGTPLSAPLTTHPMMAAMNAMGYDAWTLGNHEYNFGSEILTGILGQAAFPSLQANVTDDGRYGLGSLVQPYLEKAIGPEGIKIAILGIGNHRIPNYELPSNIPGLTFTNPIDKAQELSDQLRSDNDLLIALTHIGFTINPASVEVDENVDTVMAADVSGLDVIVGSHSHTNPATGFGDYKYLPTVIGGPNNTPVLVHQAYRYNNTLGEIIVGLRPVAGGGYEVVSRAGQYFSVTGSTAEDEEIKAIVDPYVAAFAAYNDRVVGQTTVAIDALEAFTQETNAANLQADAAVYELAQNGIEVDFHLSGAMTNRAVATEGPYPVTLKVSDMFTLMPYENSLVVINMNGPQLKAVLERAYRNYYYYKYVPDYGGYSHYTTCMIDTNSVGKITYNDRYPELPSGNNVVALTINGQHIDFDDADTFYRVSTVNYLAAGSCNFNDNGVSLWPLDQIFADTQFYVRDAVIDYITDQGTISPAIEGRLSFAADTTAPNIVKNIVSGPQFGAYVTSATTLRISISDDLAGIQSCAITATGPDGVTEVSCRAGDNDLTLSGLDGVYTIDVSATDKAGNTATLSEANTLDNTAPAFGECPVGGPFLYNSGEQAVGPITVDDGIGSGVDLEGSVLVGLVDTGTIGVQEVTFTTVDNLGTAAEPQVCRYQVSIRATRQQLIDDLVAFRATITNPRTGWWLDSAIARLNHSLFPAFWQDDNRLNPKSGMFVFYDDREAIRVFWLLSLESRNPAFKVTMKEFIVRTQEIDRILAQVAIDDAIAAGGNNKMIAAAQFQLAAGDRDAARGWYIDAIDHYRNAWVYAILAVK
ncbi:MAG: 5'-nucleotidase C-terminal domain-containing protein [Anaerolineae bacterium]|nr:5'-nucleotidase C-terminal domain-containing protein [Anaerolineae bacterium]